MAMAGYESRVTLTGDGVPQSQHSTGETKGGIYDEKDFGCTVRSVPGDGF
jgi:hypothetical protein